MFATRWFKFVFRASTTRTTIYPTSPPAPTGPAGSSAASEARQASRDGSAGAANARTPLKADASCRGSPGEAEPTGQLPPDATSAAVTWRGFAPPGTEAAQPAAPGRRATLRARGAPAGSGRAAPPRPVSHPAWERVAGSGAVAGTRRRGYPGPGRGRRETPAVVWGGNGGSAGAGAPGAALPPVPLAPSFHSAHWREAGGRASPAVRCPVGSRTHPSKGDGAGEELALPIGRGPREGGPEGKGEVAPIGHPPPSPAACQSNESRRAARPAGAGRGPRRRGCLSRCAGGSLPARGRRLPLNPAARSGRRCPSAGACAAGVRLPGGAPAAAHGTSRRGRWPGGAASRRGLRAGCLWRPWAGLGRRRSAPAPPLSPQKLRPSRHAATTGLRRGLPLRRLPAAGPVRGSPFPAPPVPIA